MSLVDPKEARVNVALKKKWNITIKEMEEFFEEEGASSVIENLLQDEEVKKYFNYRLVQNFEAYTKPYIKLDKETSENIEWLLNQEALRRDVKVNVEVKILIEMDTTSNIKDICQRLSKYELCDIICNMEEAIDDIFDKEPTSIFCGRLQEQRENNTFRESIILL